MRVGSALLFGAAAVALLAACGSDSQTGSCKGYEPGGYYQLEFNNFTTAPVTVRVNGRFVGSVIAGTLQPDGTTTPGYHQLGEFPICDHTVVDFSGAGISGSTKVCSTPVITSDACNAARAHYCWLTISGVPPSGLPTANPTPIASNPQCEAVAACVGGFKNDTGSGC
ncbi:MAG TPA: hypothetical protein VMV18_00555 [bacterium]|nr:hypothetical protein [bacterium]